MKGSCRVSASAALHEGSSSSCLSRLRISGYNSVTVGRRFFFLLAEFFGCPRTNCPLDALLPRSSQYSTCCVQHPSVDGLSKIEKRSDLLISTLRSYVEQWPDDSLWSPNF